MKTSKDDEVRGVIVGGDYQPWQVFYDGRPQSGKEYADDDAQAIVQGTARITELKRECCGHPLYLYPDSSLWEIRL